MAAHINISDIVYDEFYKISKSNYSHQLRASLELSGMLEVPYLLKRDSVYYIFTCHNRIRILQESGIRKIREIKSIVLEEPDAEIFMSHLALKMYRNELGPFGRIKGLWLLKSVFKLDPGDLNEFGLRILKLQPEILDDNKFIENMAALPEGLVNYIDDRDISFKIIKDILALPMSWLEIINTLLKEIPVRVNIFRAMIDNLFDIYRMSADVSVIGSLEYSDDKTLNDSIFSLRYPEFSRLKGESHKIIDELSCKGLSIEFPEYLEKASITLKLEINKKNDLSNELKKVWDMDPEKLKKLMSLL